MSRERARTTFHGRLLIVRRRQVGRPQRPFAVIRVRHGPRQPSRLGLPNCVGAIGSVLPNGVAGSVCQRGPCRAPWPVTVSRGSRCWTRSPMTLSARQR